MTTTMRQNDTSEFSFPLFSLVFLSVSQRRNAIRYSRLPLTSSACDDVWRRAREWVNFSSHHIEPIYICELWCEYSDDISLCQILIGMPLWHMMMIFHLPSSLSSQFSSFLSQLYHPLANRKYIKLFQLFRLLGWIYFLLWSFSSSFPSASQANA